MVSEQFSVGHKKPHKKQLKSKILLFIKSYINMVFPENAIKFITIKKKDSKLIHFLAYEIILMKNKIQLNCSFSWLNES